MASKKVGRPTEYKGEETCNLVYKLCLIGLTDKQIADILDISEQSFNVWKKKHPKLVESIKAGKDQADAEVALALYKRATGYSHRDTKAQWVQDETGGRWEYADLIREYPPDTQAASLWLRNRKSLFWRDKQEIEHGASDSLAELLAKIDGSGRKLPAED